MSTAPVKVDYYFSAMSSFAYVGNAAFHAMAKRLSLDVTYRPVKLGEVFARSGGVAVKDRDPARLRNRLLELKRWKLHHGLEMNVEPKFFPTDPTLADLSIIAVQEAGGDAAALITAIMRKLWVEEQNIAERDVIAACLDACGEDREAVLKAADSDAIKAIYAANTERGLEVDIIGSPCVVYQGEAFWGQDRFFMAEEAILSGRAPIIIGR
ncbi:2-hydroxychromene-2-carboxylate isomerase [uncultured Cohaesibacter sp.]|uniref:2-hydroxychromene-2-carboxylate isomerase n=1 Tax=uncultured Cohaesibacter sp. TaxID=1002546 RepID=UPI0029C74A05|nr:2-hydroxychromene-2-carboxylate isomerase [uncultured Cohaesibacter sp.]